MGGTDDVSRGGAAATAPDRAEKPENIVNQRSIYDLRYSGDGYDGRSPIRVLTAEAITLRSAAQRAVDSIPGLGALTVFDFGYGTGRVTNEFALEFPANFSDRDLDLHVIAYDVSSVGLSKAAYRLVKDHGFDVHRDLGFDPAAERGYVAGSVRRIADGATVTMTFVHGNETEGSGAVGDLALRVNGGDRISLTTSWYSALSHIPGSAARAAFFRMLSEVTDPRGELIVAPSVSGDLIDLQEYWRRRRLTDDVVGHPIEADGDVIYETELSQRNFWHVFGDDLWEMLTANAGPEQRVWLEAIRLPADEFQSVEEEQLNYSLAQAFNRRIGHRRWGPDDYRQVHTAAAIRSGAPNARAR
jgi:SAM-dependent methyltransferase